MKSIHSKALQNGRQGERGVALVITLLLLILMIALTLAMVIATSSDTLINHYYRNFRSSFYAADSGLNIARQSMANQLMTALDGSSVSLTASPPSLPLPVGTENTIQTAISNTYGSGYISINSGQAGSSWPGKFEITSVCLQSACGVASVPTCQVSMSTGSSPSNTPVLSGPCSSIVLPTFTSKPPCPSPVPAGCGSIAAIDYLYPYTMTAVGQSMANEQVTLEDSGYMSVDVTVGTGGQQLSFAAFGTFLDQYPGWPNCGNPFAGGTLTGKIYTNQGWTWGLGQNYTFAGQVGSVSPNFYWNYGNTGSCDSNPNLSDKQGGNSITPTWDVKPPQLGITPLPLPPNDFNQKEAVVDSRGNSWTIANSDGTYTTLPVAQQESQMNAILKDVNGNTPFNPQTWVETPGVYLPYTGSGSSATFAGGGIYVDGDANVTLTASTSGSHNLQVFTISQAANGTPTTTTGSPNVSTSTSGGYTTTTTTTTTTTSTPTSATTTTITIDLTAGTTSETSSNTVSTQSSWSTTTQVAQQYNCGTSHHPQTCTNNSSNTTNGNNPTTQNTTNASLQLAGEPENLSQTQETEGAMLYVDGNINSLSGPNSGAAIQNTSAVTITAADNITITGNITYATEPVTLNSSDSLVSGGNNGQVLGIFTANPTGVIGFSAPTSGQNMEVDASMAAISSGGSGSVYNIGNAIGTMTWVGGRIANTTNNCNCNQRNIYFDQRFAQGFAPPWFPATTVTPTGPASGTVSTVTIQRTQWVDQTAW